MKTLKMRRSDELSLKTNYLAPLHYRIFSRIPALLRGASMLSSKSRLLISLLQTASSCCTSTNAMKKKYCQKSSF